MEEIEDDRRYRMLVTLERSDRPVAFTFHCPRCTRRVVELVNADITNISDISDFSNSDTPLVGHRCDGYTDAGYKDGRIVHDRCHVWYYFANTTVK